MAMSKVYHNRLWCLCVDAPIPVLARCAASIAETAEEKTKTARENHHEKTTRPLQLRQTARALGVMRIQGKGGRHSTQIIHEKKHPMSPTGS